LESVWEKLIDIEAIARISPGIPIDDTGVFIEVASQLRVLVYNAESIGLTQANLAIFKRKRRHQGRRFL
jgi:hypothetical protein